MYLNILDVIDECDPRYKLKVYHMQPYISGFDFFMH